MPLRFINDKKSKPRPITKIKHTGNVSLIEMQISEEN
jgi:hypothetical protein